MIAPTEICPLMASQAPTPSAKDCMNIRTNLTSEL